MKYSYLNLLAFCASFISFQVQVQGIHDAAISGDFNKIISLLSKPYKPDMTVNRKDSTNGNTALHYASKFGREKIAQLLLSHYFVGAEIHDAAISGDFNKIMYLLSRSDIEINEKDKDGRTALHYASATGNEAIVELLLSHPAIKVNEKENIHGRTALYLASDWGHENIVELLLSHPEIKVNEKDILGFTALHRASSKGDENIVELLLFHPEISVNEKDKQYGMTALHMASQEGHEAIVKLLLCHSEIKVNEKDYGRWTALHWASYHGHEAIVKLLVSRSEIKVNRKDSVGLTAFDVAKTEAIKERIKEKMTGNNVILKFFRVGKRLKRAIFFRA